MTTSETSGPRGPSGPPLEAGEGTPRWGGGSPGPLLRVEDLVVRRVSERRPSSLLDGVTLEVRPGEIVGLVGESGAGKTMTALAILGLLPRGVRVAAGRILWRGLDLLGLDSGEMRAVRGREIAMVFQDPMTSLHPGLRVEDQVAEAVMAHDASVPRDAAAARARDLLRSVSIPDEALDGAYPHQWSGGMRQRAMIAMALANRPGLVLADEPTTALDVVSQARVLDLLHRARDETGTAVLLITHDSGVVAEVADHVMVLHRGRIVEAGPAPDLFRSPRDPRTAALLGARRPRDVARSRGAGGADPGGGGRSYEPGEPPVAGVRPLVVERLVTEFPRRRGRPPLRAVDGVSFTLGPGETLGLVGESGSGKSTLARTVLGLERSSSGSVLLNGIDVSRFRGRWPRALRRRIQIVFQDPSSSLNPRRRVAELVADPLRVHGLGSKAARRGRALELLEMVGLAGEYADRFPGELSGGERQRVAIARAVAVEPSVLLLDEPVSSLDVPVRGQVVGVLERLRRELGLAYLFITHDLSVIREVADRVAVLYRGRVVEAGPREAVYESPAHPYTRALLDAVPASSPEGRRSWSPWVTDNATAGDASETGCRYRDRCPIAGERCAVEEPPLEQAGPEGHARACFFPGLEPAAERHEARDQGAGERGGAW